MTVEVLSLETDVSSSDSATTSNASYGRSSNYVASSFGDTIVAVGEIVLCVEGSFQFNSATLALKAFGMVNAIQGSHLCATNLTSAIRARVSLDAVGVKHATTSNVVFSIDRLVASRTDVDIVDTMFASTLAFVLIKFGAQFVSTEMASKVFHVPQFIQRQNVLSTDSSPARCTTI